MRDDQNRKLAVKIVDRLQHSRLVLSVEAVGRLVQYQQRRFAQQGPRDRESLPLAVRKKSSAIADNRCRGRAGSLRTSSSAAASRSACHISSSRDIAPSPGKIRIARCRGKAQCPARRNRSARAIRQDSTCVRSDPIDGHGSQCRAAANRSRDPPACSFPSPKDRPKPPSGRLQSPDWRCESPAPSPSGKRRRHSGARGGAELDRRHRESNLLGRRQRIRFRAQ